MRVWPGSSATRLGRVSVLHCEQANKQSELAKRAEKNADQHKGTRVTLCHGEIVTSPKKAGVAPQNSYQRKNTVKFSQRTSCARLCAKDDCKHDQTHGENP